MRFSKKQIITCGLALALFVVGLLQPGINKSADAACAPAPTDLGVSSMTINVPTTTTYRAYSRMAVDTSINDSYFLQVDGNCPVIVGDNSSTISPCSPQPDCTKIWIWVDFLNGNTATKADFLLTSGTHTIVMSGRESGVALDRVLFLNPTDSCLPPNGTGDNCTNQDTTPPTVSITGPQSGATVNGVVSISANAVDNTGGSGVNKVDFYRGSTLIGSDSTSPYTTSWDTTKVSDGSYTLSANASDGESNVGTSSNIVVTVKNNDTSAPSDPGNFTVTSNNYNSVSLSWSASTDDKGVAGYNIYRNGSLAPIATITSTSYKDNSVTDNTSYIYQVEAFDAAGNKSAKVGLGVTTPLGPDQTPPTAPTNLTGSASDGNVALKWGASTDNTGVTSYLIRRGTIVIATVSGNTTSYNDSSVQPDTSYSYVVIARDAAGNSSQESNIATIKTPPIINPVDNPPSTPANLSASSVSSSQVNLSWSPSTDDHGVVGYKVYRNGSSTPIANVTSTSFGDSTVQAGQTYTYQVAAYDIKQDGSKTNPVSVTVQTEPVNPQYLTFTATDDAYIVKRYPNKNNGSAKNFIIDTSPARDGLLKFTVSGVKGRTVTAAKILLYGVGNSNKGGDFDPTSNNWNESTVTWSNAPLPLSVYRLASVGAVTKNNFVTVDVRNFVRSDGTYSFRVTSTSNDTMRYATSENTSKENTVAPKLLISVQ